MNPLRDALLPTLAALLTLSACAHGPVTGETGRAPRVVVEAALLAPTQAEACARVAPLEVTTEEEAARAAGILPGDYAALRGAAQAQRATVTFRDSNPACAPHLAAGVRSKAHDILQKTWDAKNLAPADQQLAGLVSDLFKKPPPGTIVEAPRLTMQDGEPVTCDYDLMDQLEDDGARVPGESERDLALRAALNASLPDTARGHRDRVMHGAQTAYRDYLRRHADEPELFVLYKPEAPLSVFGADGRAFRLPRVEDALNFYRCRGAALPAEWDVEARARDGAMVPVR